MCKQNGVTVFVKKTISMSKRNLECCYRHGIEWCWAMGLKQISGYASNQTTHTLAKQRRD